MKFSPHWFWIFLVIPMGIGVRRLQFDTEVLNLLPQQLPVVRGLELYQQNFSNARELIVTIRAASAEDADRAATAIGQELRRARSLVSSVYWQPPWMEHPEQAAEFAAFSWFNSPPEKLSELDARLSPSRLKPLLAAAREQLATTVSPIDLGQLAYDPYRLTQLPNSGQTSSLSLGQTGQNLFSSADGTFRILFVEAAGELSTYRECAKWFRGVKRLVDRAVFESHAADVAIQFTGRPAFVTEISGGMERDVTASVAGTSLIIAGLFWLAHRRWRPMLWLVTLLALILIGTFAFGGLVFGTMNVISMGFAAILLGLAVDYAVVHYQEAISKPDATIPEVRRMIAPSIFWAAITTISAFLVLNLGGLPGLAQLGTLIAIGVGLSASVMVFAYLPPLFPDRWSKQVSSASQAAAALDQGSRAHVHRQPVLPTRAAWSVTWGLAVIATIIVALRFPGIDHSPQALRPRRSEAYAALEAMKSLLGMQQGPLWLIVSGRNEREAFRLLQESDTVLHRAKTGRLITDYLLPTALWPQPEFQNQNRAAAITLARRKNVLKSTAVEMGFSTNALVLTDEILNSLQRAAEAPVPFWPTNEMSRFIFGKFVSKTAQGIFAMGLVYPSTNVDTARLSGQLVRELPRERVWLCGWELLARSVLGRVLERLWLVVVPMVGLVLLSLWLAFRQPREVLLSLAALALSSLTLLAVMSLAGWKWNLMNLMALPVMLGTGVDYSIFTQLALRRHGGDLRAAYSSVGRALLLCGATAVAGFGSLAWSPLSGMASLGRVCAVAIAANMLVSVFLLPSWWSASSKKGTKR